MEFLDTGDDTEMKAPTFEKKSMNIGTQELYLLLKTTGQERYD